MGGTLCGGGGVRSSSLKYEDKAELLADFPNCGAVSPWTQLGFLFFFFSKAIITPEQAKDTAGQDFWRKLPKSRLNERFFFFSLSLSETQTLLFQRGSPSSDPSLAIRGVAPHIPLITLPWHLSSFRPRIRRNTTMAHRETLTCNERPGNNGH